MNTSLSFDEFVRFLADFKGADPAMVRSMFLPRQAEVAPFLGEFGALMYAKREKLRDRGKWVPERFWEDEVRPVSARPKPVSAKPTSRPVADYSHDELVQIIRPAFEAFLAAGGV